MKLISISSAPLTKFCPPEFNIRKGCNTIRLGTLYDFRAEEDEKLRDVGEGTFSYSIDFPELTKVSSEWISAFELEGGGQAQISEMKVGPDGIMIKGMSLSGSCHNCWIYCLSKNSESAGNITDTHQDKWFLPVERLESFASYLVAEIWDGLVYSDLPESITNNVSMQEIHKRLSLSFEVREVDYGLRALTILREEDLPASSIEKVKDSVAFIKPKIFENESEIRIAIWLHFDGRKISIMNNSKIIKLRPIDKII